MHRGLERNTLLAWALSTNKYCLTNKWLTTAVFLTTIKTLNGWARTGPSFSPSRDCAAHLSSGYFRQGTISFSLLPWNSAPDFNHSRPTVWIALSSLSPVLYQSISMLKWILCFISPDSIWIYYYTLFKLSTLQYTTTNKTIVAVPPGPWDPANKKYSWRSRGKRYLTWGTTQGGQGEYYWEEAHGWCR